MENDTGAANWQRKFRNCIPLPAQHAYGTLETVND